MHTVDIFIKSFKPDFWLLTLSLETIKKNVTGYNQIILLIPEKDKHEFETRYLPERTLVHYIDDKSPGWLYQQACKMQAHKYCFADYIMFTDSDCFFTYPVNVQDCIKNDKPEILYTAWEDVGDAMVWKEPTEKFLKEPVEWEMMRRNQQVYHRSSLIAISEFEPNLENVIMNSQRFSEFNTMSSYCYKHEKDKYTFTNTAEWTYVPALAEQTWSHASKAPGVSETHLREYIRLVETIAKSFGVPLPQ